MSAEKQETAANRGAGMLAAVERIGNKLPDPAVLFIGLLFAVWILSFLFSFISFDAVDPRTGQAIVVNNLLSGAAFTEFLSVMVTNFSHFHPVGVVLVAMLGIGVAEHTGFITTAIRALLNVTAKWLLTPMVILVGIVSHSAVDAGYVLVIPLGGVIFYAAGRHPLAGIAAAFAGVSGGFSANFVPSSLDPLLQGLTQAGAQIIDPDIIINPLNNYFFTTASSLLIVGLGWLITDRIVEPRLKNVEVDGNPDDLPEIHEIQPNERKGLRWALIAMVVGLALLFGTAMPETSPWRAPNGDLTTGAAPMMRSIVSLIFLLFLVPGRRVRHRRGHHEEFEGHDRRYGARDEQHGLLPRHHVLDRAVCVRLQHIQPRRAARGAGCGRTQSARAAGSLHHCRHRLPDRVREHLRRLGKRQVGAAGAHLRTDADDTRYIA